MGKKNATVILYTMDAVDVWYRGWDIAFRLIRIEPPTPGKRHVWLDNDCTGYVFILCKIYIALRPIHIHSHIHSTSEIPHTVSIILLLLSLLLLL